MSNKKTIFQLIRSFFLLLGVCSYQSLLLILTADIFPAAAQTAPRLCAVPGKDGPGGTLNGIVNTYYPGAPNTTVAAGSQSIPVGIPTGGTPIEAGDLLLVIQMQGADINSNNNDSYGDGVAGGGNDTNTLAAPVTTGASGNLNNSNFIAGNYEYVVATGAVSGGSVPIQGTGAGNGLINSYVNTPYDGNQGQKTYQVVRIPQYSSATLSSTLTAAAWNGSTGGILAYDVAGNLDLGGANIDINAKGFRGGAGRDLNGQNFSPPFQPTDYRTLANVRNNGSKGEGIAGTPRHVYDPDATTTGFIVSTGVEGYPNGSSARGAPGNAGGGSTDGEPFGGSNRENSGGGGGANGGAGGIGGRSWRSELFIGGFGGASFPGTPARVILGGGGGAGTTNDGTSDTPGIPNTGIASSGATGGGMALIRSASVSGSGTINANGGSAFNVRQDGGGGGGAGGSVVVTTANNNLSGLTVNVNGGKGGDVRFFQPHGPGGGGGGGLVFASPGVTVNANGGNSGGTGDPIDPFFNFAASSGQNGAIATVSNITSIPGASSGAECIPQLTINKTTSTPGPIIKPGQATYTITVTNAVNRAAATNVNISDPLPSGFTFDDSTTPIVTLNGGATRTNINNPSTGDTVVDFGSFDISGGGNVTITFTTSISPDVTDGEYNNSATATYFDPTRITANGTTSVNYDSSNTGEEVIVGSPISGFSSLQGVKRITNITRNGVPLDGINFNTFVDDPNDPSDNLAGWSQLLPVGLPNVSQQIALQSGDEVEYTIYFLSDGTQPVDNVRFCDPIPSETSFIADSFGGGRGVLLNLANTNTSQTNFIDGDHVSYFSPVAPLPSNNVCPNQVNPTGAVTVNFDSISHIDGSNFGFIRFRVRVD